MAEKTSKVPKKSQKWPENVQTTQLTQQKVINEGALSMSHFFGVRVWNHEYFSKYWTNRDKTWISRTALK